MVYLFKKESSPNFEITSYFDYVIGFGKGLLSNKRNKSDIYHTSFQVDKLIF